jgi:hypothetical protein
MMTVEDFIKYSIEESWQKFTLYDVDKEEEVFTGTIDECPDIYIEAEVCTFDVIDEYSPRLTLNVTLE